MAVATTMVETAAVEEVVVIGKHLLLVMHCHVAHAAQALRPRILILIMIVFSKRLSISVIIIIVVVFGPGVVHTIPKPHVVGLCG